MWRTKAPDPEKIELLNLQREQHDLHPLVIHDSYLINLAAPLRSSVKNRSMASAESWRGQS